LLSQGTRNQTDGFASNAHEFEIASSAMVATIEQWRSRTVAAADTSFNALKTAVLQFIRNVATAQTRVPASVAGSPTNLFIFIYFLCAQLKIIASSLQNRQKPQLLRVKEVQMDRATT
jgi:hypothetical protein